MPEEVGAQNNNTPLLQLVGVGKSFDSQGQAALQVLLDVDLELAQGESVAIVGPSGSGKSTLLNLIGTLETPDTGKLLWQGRDLAALDEVALAEFRNRQVGFIFQHHHLLPQCSALENVLLPTLARGDYSARKAQEARARQLLQRVGLENRVEHRPAQLSGGERQRVAVVRALINEPALLLADEPTGSLDADSAGALGDLLVELNLERELALVLVTHSPELANRMQRQVELRAGALHDGGVTE
ncbi:MAG: lipoprotein-releasing system ATP-binding protein [Candidatus Paceibacteria bacterium]|jgi:lipoprotein-releasing system ATP-binding protein